MKNNENLKKIMQKAYCQKGLKVPFSNLLGKEVTDVYQYDTDAIVILTNDNKATVLLHFDECCEHVYVDDVCGDLEDVRGLVVRAEEASNMVDTPNSESGSETWTFYKLDTVKGDIVIRFVGSSNGNYSEAVTVFEVDIDSL